VKIQATSEMTCDDTKNIFEETTKYKHSSECNYAKMGYLSRIFLVVYVRTKIFTWYLAYI